MEPIKMTLLRDDGGNECLYVEGERWKCDGEPTVYVCDLIELAGGRPIALDQFTVDRPGDAVERPVDDGGNFVVWRRWPEKLEDGMKWRETETTTAS